MPQVEVGLGPIVRHKYLSVLIRRHRSGIDIDVGIELLGRHAEPRAFNSRPKAAAVTPLPTELTTPPVKICIWSSLLPKRGGHIILVTCPTSFVTTQCICYRLMTLIVSGPCRPHNARKNTIPC